MIAQSSSNSKFFKKNATIGYMYKNDSCDCETEDNIIENTIGWSREGWLDYYKNNLVWSEFVFLIHIVHSTSSPWCIVVHNNFPLVFTAGPQVTLKTRYTSWLMLCWEPVVGCLFGVEKNKYVEGAGLSDNPVTIVTTALHCHYAMVRVQPTKSIIMDFSTDIWFS